MQRWFCEKARSQEELRFVSRGHDASIIFTRAARESLNQVILPESALCIIELLMASVVSAVGEKMESLRADVGKCSLSEFLHFYFVL